MKTKIYRAGLLLSLAFGRAFSMEPFPDDFDDLFGSTPKTSNSQQASTSNLFSSLTQSQVSSPHKPVVVTHKPAAVSVSRVVELTTDDFDGLFNGVINPLPIQQKKNTSLFSSLAQISTPSKLTPLMILSEFGIQNPTDCQLEFAEENRELDEHDLLRGVMNARLMALHINVPTVEQLNFATDPAHLNANDDDLLRGAMRARLVEMGIDIPRLEQINFASDPAHLNYRNDGRLLLRGAMKARLIEIGINVPTRSQLDFATHPAHLNDSVRALREGVMNARLVACGINQPTLEQVQYAVAHLNDADNVLIQGAMTARLVACGINIPILQQVNFAVTQLNAADNVLVRGAMDARLNACGIRFPTPHQVNYAAVNLNVADNVLVRGAMSARLQHILGRVPTQQEITIAIADLNAPDALLRSALGIREPEDVRKEQRAAAVNIMADPMEIIDYYYTQACNLLNVPKNSASNVVKRSYVRLALLRHPDKNDGSPRPFQELNEANAYIKLYNDNVNNFRNNAYFFFLIGGDNVERLMQGW